MWPLLIPIAGIVIYQLCKDDESPAPRVRSILERNLERLNNILASNSGIKVAILGQPGAGKSSLLKKMTKGKVEPLPIIGTHTDATNWASDSSCNLLSKYENYTFADAPGYDTSSHPVNVFLSSFPFNKFDVLVFVTNGKIHEADEKIFRSIENSGKPYCIARSYSESLENHEKVSVANDLRTRLNIYASQKILFFSNRTASGIEEVFESITSA